MKRWIKTDNALTGIPAKLIPLFSACKNCCSERTNKYIEFYCGIVLSRHSIAFFIIIKFLIFLPWPKEGFASRKQSSKTNFDHEFKENNIWVRADMEFLFESSPRYLTSERSG